MAWIALAVISLVLITATIRRNTVWNDELRLWEDMAAKSPDKPRVLSNLAKYHLGNNEPKKAIAPLLRALDREPGSTESLNILGMLLDQIPEARGRYNNGYKFLTADDKVDVRFMIPWFANSRNNLGLVYELAGDRTKALECYERAVALAPKDEAPWLNLALLSAHLGNARRGAEAFEKLKQLNPQRAKAVESTVFRKQ